MFYSHTFLARKGPLGTVWCAAHLQHKLKKSHYTATNIPSTVERIMYPEVPIALRMSGHLLLGVVRIYSKQVDYLYEDCNVVRITINRVFTSVSVNLPEDATHAPFHSVTLPEKFALDSLELDENYKEWSVDSHLKSQEDITLSEQIPTGTDPYIVIKFNEHDLRSSSFTNDNGGSSPTPMEEDVPPPAEAETSPAVGLRDPSPSNQFTVAERTTENNSPREFPSIEIMRDARPGFDFNSSPILPDRAEPDEFLEEQINKDRETPPVIKEAMLPEGPFSPSQKHGEQHSVGHLDSPMLFVHESPEMEIRATPPVPQPKVTRRKRKQHFDETTVLSNEHMKKALDDTRGIRRVKRNCPLTFKAIWKQNNRLRKDNLFSEPFLTGSCGDLQDTYKEDFISSKPHLLATEKTHQETTAAQTPVSRPDNDTEIEILRNNEYASPDRYMPSFSTAVPSPHERSYVTPERSNFGFQSERLETTEGDGILPTGDTAASSMNFDSELRTPDTFYGKGLQADHTALSDIPELVASPGELGFLEQDDNSPAGSPGTPEYGIRSKNQGTPQLQQLSSRTRAVAQYLKKQSSTTPTLGDSNEPSGDLSLNKILEGKSRKISARMFAETLVLKNYGLVDVHQDSPYNVITLKVTPKLSKGEFSV